MSTFERQFWHPVSYSEELGSAPLSVKLCGESLVVWRSVNGEISALRDLCIHRGTALSIGTICDDSVVCPYHGWRFNGEGKCTHIPQLSCQSKIPPKAKVPAYQACEKYGLIWVVFEKPRSALPEVPELTEDSWKIVKTGPFQWKSSSARQIENFTDFAHFPFVHPGLLGDPDRPNVPEHSVSNDGLVLRYEIIRPEAKNSEEFPIFGNPNQDQPTRHNKYELFIPYTLVLRINWSNTPNKMIYFFASQPIDHENCSGYCIVAKNYGEDDSEVIRKFEETIFNQDKRIVESQRPEQVPYDLSEELHLKFDTVAVAYRKAIGSY